MSPLRTLAPLAVFGIATLALAGCATTSTPAATPDTTETVLEPATITLYTSEPQEKADELVAAFNEIHPEITVEVFRAGTGDLTTRVATERESGAVQADVFLAADAGTFENYAAGTSSCRTRRPTSRPSTPMSSTPRATTPAPGSSRPSSPTTPA
jgi:iron(III) transport system substrate-binding protein